MVKDFGGVAEGWVGEEGGVQQGISFQALFFALGRKRAVDDGFVAG